MPQIAPWFADAKLGVFIHWTLKNVQMDAGDTLVSNDLDAHRALAEGFTASAYDPRDWARQFASWGARYAVLTTKHHIGFALFDEPNAPFTSARNSPAGRDIVGPYVEALHAEGLKVGLYYSLPDWSHPDYASCAGGDNPRSYSAQDEPERWQRFREQMFAEVRHLCTVYGKIDLLWFDGDWERSAEQWASTDLAEMILDLQPHVILNNRLRHPCLGHYGTPESTAPLAPKGDPFWEFCFTPGDNWDGQAANVNVKQPPELVRIFADMVSMGGNCLINVAPAADGSLPTVQTEAMAGLGRWVASHAEAIYGTQAGLPHGLFNGASTHNGGTLYLTTFDAPRDELVVKGLQSNVRRVTHLRSGKELAWRRSGGRANFGQAGWLFIRLPAELLDEYATVLKVEFEDDTCTFATPTGGRQTFRGKPVLTEQALVADRDG